MRYLYKNAILQKMMAKAKATRIPALRLKRQSLDQIIFSPGVP
jgi:hypothetical protein